MGLFGRIVNKFEDSNRKCFEFVPYFLWELLIPQAVERIERAIRLLLERSNERLRARLDQLQALAPRRVLERGYVYVVDAESGALVSRAAAARADQDVRMVFADGARAARVLGDEVIAVATPGATPDSTPAVTSQENT